MLKWQQKLNFVWLNTLYPPNIKKQTDSDNFSWAISNLKVLGYESHGTSKPSFYKHTSRFLTPVLNVNLLMTVPNGLVGVMLPCLGVFRHMEEQ